MPTIPTLADRAATAADLTRRIAAANTQKTGLLSDLADTPDDAALTDRAIELDAQLQRLQIRLQANQAGIAAQRQACIDAQRQAGIDAAADCKARALKASAARVKLAAEVDRTRAAHEQATTAYRAAGRSILDDAMCFVRAHAPAGDGSHYRVAELCGYVRNAIPDTDMLALFAQTQSLANAADAATAQLRLRLDDMERAVVQGAGPYVGKPANWMTFNEAMKTDA